jgi:hypothetical protein
MMHRTNAPGLGKDEATGMIQALDQSEYKMILARRKAKREDQDLRARVERLESLVQELLAR